MSLEKVDQSYVPLSTCQPSSADQRPPCFISSASPLCGCSFCPGCTRTTATCCRAPARCRRAPAPCWATPCGCRAPAHFRRCPTLSTRHSRELTRVLSTNQRSQAVLIKGRLALHARHLYLGGCSFCLPGSCTLLPCSCSLLPCSCTLLGSCPLPPMLNSVYVSLERADQSFVYKSAKR